MPNPTIDVIVTVTIGATEHRLTIEEARALADALRKVLPPVVPAPSIGEQLKQIVEKDRQYPWRSDEKWRLPLSPDCWPRNAILFSKL